MSSLWTPQGEHRVEREDGGSPAGTPPAAAPPPGRPDAEAAAGGEGELDEEEAEVVRQMAELREHLLAAPPEDVIANHAYGLFELAAIHLSAPQPSLESARLAIDAFGAIVEGLGERLGHHAGTLREGLSQIRIGFVTIAKGAAAANGDDAKAPSGSGDAGDEPAEDA